ncbi:hypothetical protein K474DRAFT_1677100 [Panus rudis PR-1116 ss-1]|nr:hypothetical protein K474DRAFT_1677100 [Panus rudis PR-1116 ss-1]
MSSEQTQDIFECPQGLLPRGKEGLDSWWYRNSTIGRNRNHIQLGCTRVLRISPHSRFSNRLSPRRPLNADLTTPVNCQFQCMTVQSSEPSNGSLMQMQMQILGYIDPSSLTKLERKRYETIAKNPDRDLHGAYRTTDLFEGSNLFTRTTNAIRNCNLRTALRTPCAAQWDFKLYIPTSIMILPYSGSRWVFGFCILIERSTGIEQRDERALRDKHRGITSATEALSNRGACIELGCLVPGSGSQVPHLSLSMRVDQQRVHTHEEDQGSRLKTQLVSLSGGLGNKREQVTLNDQATKRPSHSESTLSGTWYRTFTVLELRRIMDQASSLKVPIESTRDAGRRTKTRGQVERIRHDLGLLLALLSHGTDMCYQRLYAYAFDSLTYYRLQLNAIPFKVLVLQGLGLEADHFFSNRDTTGPGNLDPSLQLERMLPNPLPIFLLKNFAGLDSRFNLILEWGNPSPG